MNCLHYFTQLRIIFTGIVWSEHRIIEKLAISLLSSRLSISLSVPLALSFFSLLVKLNSIQKCYRDEKKSTFEIFELTTVFSLYLAWRKE